MTSTSARASLLAALEADLVGCSRGGALREVYENDRGWTVINEALPDVAGEPR